MSGITVRTLTQLVLAQMKKGNGDKIVLISCDDEGNGFHTLFYGFTDKISDIKDYKEYGLFHDDNDAKDVVLLG